MVVDGQTLSVRPKTFALLLMFLQNPYQVLSTTPTPSATPNNTTAQPRRGSFVIVSLSITLCIALYFGYTSTNSYAAKLQGSQVILPVINNIQDTDHQWVYLGAMDQLISTLKSSEKLSVMNTDYVLEIMKDAGITRSPTQQDIRRIFEVSGASLVLQSQLSGATQDYQLKYSFHFKNDVKRSVIFANNINEALMQLATKMAVFTGQSLSVSNNQLALAKTQGDIQLASRYLDRATTIINNRNLTLLKHWLKKVNYWSAIKRGSSTPPNTLLGI
jgi:hypothetical protein